ncbi:helix-turn-helix domain-containing protein [Streptomyces zagrosensis]|uniref:Transcriptional regulator with XRE-family HTH domain n=1 Tax=Streptomyces zagrosensis TaxID=1042984 RepID=A0A7W9Q5U8_9ACTN|nr:helix-turn-helix transcriptional regulator [Streptomyces zagrosensis]MBB5933327.1 transcriptional regulator with XRE-family HTH domain [Streptomyces zagrosensis]
MSSPHIGHNISEVRKIRKLSVRQLATKVNVSVSSMEKYERGSRTVPPGIIAKLAQALSVGPERITGQPYMNGAEAEDQVQGVIPELRRIMLTYDSPDDLAVAPRPLPVLAAEAETVARMRQDGRYVPMGPLLPPLLAELTHLALGARVEEDRRCAFWWLARAYRASNSLAHKLGYHDLSMAAIERVQWAADRSADPLMQVTAAYLKAGAMLRVGSFQSARRVLTGLEQEVSHLAPEESLSDPQLAVHGGILLKLAILEARDGFPDRAQQRLIEARATAAFLGERDTDHYEMSFGPTNVRIHEIASLIDSGDTEQALARLAEWGEDQQRDEWALPLDLAAERASHHHIDVASAQLAEGHRAQSFASLRRARTLSPNHTRFHPTVRAVSGTLVRLDRSQDEELAAFAHWVGA